MIKKIPTEEAVGLPLLHDITAIRADGFKGVLFPRHHVVRPEDVEALLDIGKSHLYVGELEADEVHEEDAIAAVAPFVAGDGVRFGSPKEGKIAFRADTEGLFVLNRPALQKIHQVGDYTFPTTRSLTRVAEDQLLCGGRIVPLWTRKSVVDEAVRVAREEGPLLRVLPFHAKRVGVIVTGGEIYSGRIQDRFEPIVRKKLENFPATNIDVLFADDDAEMQQNMLEDLLSRGANLIIFSGGMSVDPDDLTPSTIRRNSDGEVIQGVPVQPGNMLTLGRRTGGFAGRDAGHAGGRGDAVLLGVPGASIHSAITSFDIVLPWLFADYDYTREDLYALAEGGLL